MLRNHAASKIGNGVISLLWQLRCHCNPDHNKFSSLFNTTVVSIFPNPCLWRRSLRSNLGGIDLEKLYRATLINLNCLEILQFLILLYLHKWCIPPSIAIVEMAAPKNITRFHYQDTIYLPRPQSLAIVLVVIKLNYQVKRDKGRNWKGRKKANFLPSNLSLRPWKSLHTRQCR